MKCQAGCGNEKLLPVKVAGETIYMCEDCKQTYDKVDKIWQEVLTK